MDDDDLVKVALRAALDHILELDGEEPLTDAEWGERPDADPALFAALLSAGHVALDTARAENKGTVPPDHLRIAQVRNSSTIRVKHIPTGTVVEVKHVTPRTDAALAISMVRAAFDHRPG